MTNIIDIRNDLTGSEIGRRRRYEIRTSRNLGIIDEADQARLAEATVAIAGVGGDGGEVAVQLARLGVRRFRLADPEQFELENSNRQAGCNEHTIGTNKAEAIAAEILAIDPDAIVEVYTEGITPENTESFVLGADLVIDETEFTHHALGVRLARAARTNGIPMLTGLNVGFGCIVTSFLPDGPTLEEHLGIDPRADLEQIAATEVRLDRWIPCIPTYIRRDVLTAVATGARPAPSVAPGVLMAAGFVLTEAVCHLTARRAPVSSPRLLVHDALERRTRVMHRRSPAGVASYLSFALRNRIGRVRFERRNNADPRTRWVRIAMAVTAVLTAAGLGLAMRSGWFGGGSAAFEQQFGAPFRVFAIGWALSLVPYWWGIARLFVGLYRGQSTTVIGAVVMNRLAWFLPYGMVLAAGGHIPARLVPWAVAFVAAATVAFAWRIHHRRPPRLPRWVPARVRALLGHDELEALMG